MKKVILINLTILLSFPLAAQIQFRYGISLQPHFAQASLVQDSVVDPLVYAFFQDLEIGQVGLWLGPNLQIDLPGPLAIQTGLQVGWTGFRNKWRQLTPPVILDTAQGIFVPDTTFPYTRGTNKFRYFRFRVPVRGEFHITPNLYVLGGPTFQYLMTTQALNINETPEGRRDRENFPSLATDLSGLNRFFVGIDFGLGYQGQLGQGPQYFVQGLISPDLQRLFQQAALNRRLVSVGIEAGLRW